MRTTTRLALLGTSVALVATAISATAAQAEDGGTGDITIDKVAVKTNSTGNLKTTVKGTVDGYYRYSFAGNSTTPAVNATGDLVRVKK
ncbi:MULTISPECIES: hypothetical protein [unclassified Streptomyces]|uniref:hypothetical protein n=1 Tax=unclassified Streptomyces TaxID=2593676 RepID=UPI0033DD2753